jgi:hypothetical protein
MWLLDSDCSAGQHSFLSVCLKCRVTLWPNCDSRSTPELQRRYYLLLCWNRDSFHPRDIFQFLDFVRVFVTSTRILAVPWTTQLQEIVFWPFSHAPTPEIPGMHEIAVM